jgi:DNA-binding transcriptional LysR family regulator
MKMRQVEAFRAVMLAQSVTQAADMLRISQPSMSRLIADFEKNTGFALFARRKGRLHPTPEATYLYNEVEKSFVGLEKISDVVRDIKNFKTGQLRIACLPGLALRFLPALITDFLRDRPQVMVSLQPRSSPKVHEWLESQQFDIGLAEPTDHPGIEVERLAFRCVCVLPKGHFLEDKDVITPQDLDGLPFISLNGDHMTSHQLRNAFGAAGVKRNICVETRLFAPACAFVAQGCGIAVVDPIAADDYKSWGVVARRFEPAITFEIGILYPIHRPHSRLVDEFAAALKDRIAPYQQ